MAYLEAHQELRQHPKTMRAARLLEAKVPHVIGHLQMLWWWALDYAQDGDITDFDPEEIAVAAMWDGDAQKFVDALLGCGKGGGAGFFERRDGRLLIHDWDDYAGKLVDRRLANARRNQEYRDRKRSRDDRDTDASASRDNHEHITSTSRDGANVEKSNVENLKNPPNPPTGGMAVLEDAKEAYTDLKASKREFPPTEPETSHAIKHLLWRVEMSNQALTLPSAMGREVKAASDMLKAGYSEDEIVGHYEYQRDRSDKGYSLHLLALNISSLHGRRPGETKPPAWAQPNSTPQQQVIPRFTGKQPPPAGLESLGLGS